MDARDQELAELRKQVEALQRRMERLEAAAPAVVGTSLTPPAAPPAPNIPSQPIPAAPVYVAAYTPPRPPVHVASESLETRIGTHWLNRVGIVAVLVGVALFLKYAFDNGWIGPAGRIAIGLLAGIAVTVWSETFRRKGYALFSYGLKAIGIGTLYLSLWAAVQVYHLVPAGVGFVAMLIVTAATVTMALTQNAQLLAGYALAGGFSTPALCSTGENHEVFLFSYVVVLAAGAVILTALRGWRRLSLGAFVGTLLMYVGWYSKHYDYRQFTPTLLFATLFFLIFAATALVPRTGERADSTTLTAVLCIANAVAYFFELYAIYGEYRDEAFRDNAMAWFAVGLAAVYVFLAQRIARQAAGAENRRAVNLIHLAVAVGFLTVAIPLKLSGHWITMGWLVESAALLYVAQRIQHNFLKIFAALALMLGIVRMLVESWPRETVLFANPRFATYLVAIAVLGLAIYGTRRATADLERLAGDVCVVLLNLLALLALYYEVQNFFQAQVAKEWLMRNYAAARSTETICGFTHSAVWMIYGAVLMFLGFRQRSAFLRWQAIVLLGVTVVKVFLFDTSTLDLGFRILSFIGLGVILLGISFLYQRGRLAIPGAGGNSGSRTEP